jgi:hypothetical protein
VERVTFLPSSSQHWRPPSIFLRWIGKTS